MTEDVEKLRNFKILQVSLGAFHTLVLAKTSEGKKVYAFGQGLTGQLGHGGDLNKSQPCDITGEIPEKVTQVAASGHGSLFLTESNEIYYAGKLKSYVSKENPAWRPKKFNKGPRLEGKKIQKIKAGSLFYAALVDEN